MVAELWAVRQGPYMAWEASIKFFRVMLTSALKVPIKNLVKENFYGKRKKKVINILTTFFISYKSDVKTFFN